MPTLWCIPAGNPCDDEKARLDNFANLLRDAPDAKGYIVFYGGRWDHYPYPHPARGDYRAVAKVKLEPGQFVASGGDEIEIVPVTNALRNKLNAQGRLSHDLVRDVFLARPPHNKALQLTAR